MASGLPIITSDNPGYEEYLNKRYVKLINPTISEIKISIINLLKDKKHLEIMKKYSYSEVIKRFNWKKNADTLLSIYKS